jgi:hypothetical protein
MGTAGEGPEWAAGSMEIASNGSGGLVAAISIFKKTHEPRVGSGFPFFIVRVKSCLEV